MHIAMFCHNYPPHPGGLEVMVRSLAMSLVRFHRVTVVTTAWNGSSGITDEAGVRVLRLPAFHQTERWGVPYPVPAGRGLRHALESAAAADVLHAHGALYPTTLMAAGAARRSGCPLVLTEHVGFVNYSSRALNALQRAAWLSVGDAVMQRVATVVVYNRRVECWLNARCPERRIEYIGNGVDTVAFRPRDELERSALRAKWGLPAHEPVVLFVGRAVPKKGLASLLTVRSNEYVLATCGAPPLRSMDRVVQLGVIDHAAMPEVFAAADVLVLPSTGEGFPLAAQEGMAAGLPVVMLWDEGYANAVDRSAIMACDTMQEIGSSISRLVESPSRRSNIGARGRAWAMRKWSWEETTAAYENLYVRATKGEF